MMMNKGTSGEIEDVLGRMKKMQIEHKDDNILRIHFRLVEKMVKNITRDKLYIVVDYVKDLERYFKGLRK